MNTGGLRVCLLLRYFTVGGLERVVISLANGLVEQGVAVHVVALGVAKRNALMTELDPRVHVTSLEGGWLRRLIEVRRLTRGRIVHIHFGDGRIHPTVRLALWFQPVVVSYHSVYSHKRTRLRNRIDRLFTSHADHVLAVSGAVEEFCVHDVGLPPEAITVIPNAISPINASPPADSDSDGALTLIALAGLYPHKNQTILLRAVALVRARGGNARLRIIGDGPEMAALFKQANELHLADAVDWYGQIWRRDLVIPLLTSSHAFVSASRFEGMPISILEAMAAGLPLMLSDIASHRQTAGQSAIYFPADGAEQLADAIAELASDPLRRKGLGEASLARAALFDYPTFIDRHLNVYRQLCDGTP